MSAYICRCQCGRYIKPIVDWQLVPKEPTPAMSAAGFCVSEAEHDPAGVYRAMLAAAPSLPTQP